MFLKVPLRVNTNDITTFLGIRKKVVLQTAHNKVLETHMNYNNQLEPHQIIDFFRQNPPIGFLPLSIDINGENIPSFIAKFDLLITADKTAKKVLRPVHFLIPKPLTHFVGTTVSEYSLYPRKSDPDVIPDAILEKFKNTKASLLVVKDLSLESPLLDSDENNFSIKLMEAFRKRKFIIMHGEALAYVPITFSSVEEYLQRFSKSRKKNFKRKLKSLDYISIKSVKTGDSFFTDDIIDKLYDLYFNVYTDSSVHFDLLSKEFFRNTLRDGECGGIVFIYRREDLIIGFNLCFIVRNYLVDKYIGLLYPESYEYNLYFISWFYNLEYCIRNKLSHYVAGWTDPEIKSRLGASFTYTFHAVYVKNRVLRFFLQRVKRFFESDRTVIESLE
jgi:hypothetical protein